MSDMDWKDDDLDRLLRQGMAARPEASAGPDLAGRAMARAKTAPTIVTRTARWRAVCSLAACLLIAGVLGLGAWKWYHSASAGSSSDYGSTYSSDTSTTSAADLTSSRNATLLLLGGGVFILALGMLTLDRLLVSDDPFRGGALI